MKEAASRQTGKYIELLEKVDDVCYNVNGMVRGTPFMATYGVVWSDNVLDAAFQVTIFFSLDDYQRMQVSDALKSHTFEKDL